MNPLTVQRKTNFRAKNVSTNFCLSTFYLLNQLFLYKKFFGSDSPDVYVWRI